MAFLQAVEKVRGLFRQPAAPAEPELILTKNQASIRREAKDTGGARGGTALLELDQMPRKACGERSEDFCAPKGRESKGIFAGVL